jgi:COMPASS component SWD3
MKFLGEEIGGLLKWSAILLTILFGTKGNLPAYAQANFEEREEQLEEEQEEKQNQELNFVPAIGNYSWNSLRLIHTLVGHQAVPDAILFSPDKKYLISAGGENDPSLRFWYLKENKEIERVRAQHTSIDAMIFSPNGETLITCGQSTRKANGQDAAINLWDWKTGSYQATFREHSHSITSLAVTPDNQVLVSGGLDGVKVWHINPQRPLFSLSSLGDPTYALAMNPNGYIVASGGNKGKVKFWNIRIGKLVSEFTPHQQAISALTFTPDGEKLITASYDRTIKVWDVSTGQLLQTLTGHSSRVRTLALNPDGKTLATSSSDGVRIWNIETGELINHLIEENQWAQALTFSQDGKRLAIGGADFQIRVWEAM